MFQSHAHMYLMIFINKIVLKVVEWHMKVLQSWIYKTFDHMDALSNTASYHP